MDRLILMRHAKAERRSASGDDFDRPLTEDGRRDAAMVGLALAKDGLAPTLALVSAAQRTVETWETMRGSCPKARAQVLRSLYNATPMEVLDALEARYPGIGERLKDDSGQIRRFVNVFVNGRNVRDIDGAATALSPGDELGIIPAMAGGRPA